MSNPDIENIGKHMINNEIDKNKETYRELLEAIDRAYKEMMIAIEKWKHYHGLKARWDALEELCKEKKEEQ